MSEADAQRVRNAIMELGDVDDAEQEQIIADFIGRKHPSAQVLHDDGVELAFSAEANNATVPQNSVAPKNSKPFAFLEYAGPELMAKHLLREHPQTIAVVLSSFAARARRRRRLAVP